MKIAVMGAGAMGAMVGGRLAKAGNQVWLVDVWKDHVEKMQRDGLLLETSEGVQILPVSATTRAMDVRDQGGYMDLVIIFVKGLYTEQAIQDAKVFIHDDTYVLTVQNGVGNADILAKYVPPERVLMGTTLAAAILLGPGHVRDSTAGSPFTQIMPLHGEITPDVQRIVETLQGAGLEAEATPEAETAIWKKLVVNCCTCGIGTITRLSCGQVCEEPDGAALVSEVIREVCAVANAKGLHLDYKENLEHFFAVYRSSTHYASMVQDAKKKAQTEVETITGAVVREGKRLGVPTPVNTTIYHLIRMISSHYNDQMY